MPRQRRGSAAPARSAPTRPTAAPARPNVTPPQPPSRGAATAAAPTTQKPQAPGQQSSGGSGLFGQMASTAAGVAVGSSIGHALGGFFGGGSSSSAPAETQQADNAVASQAQDGTYQNNWGARSCEQDAKSFTQCLDQNQGNMQICGWYLEQLKACQSAASQY
ncbi:hypothetical protein MMC08_001903 [Hypocenomyce scalaris]|nr:hypothetical protein [Hypocenomyce scalaris]